MKKITLIFLITTYLTIILFPLSIYSKGKTEQTDISNQQIRYETIPSMDFVYRTPLIQIKNTTFNVEIADTPELRAKGLMHKPYMDRTESMLFVFEHPKKASFWMKNTYVALDILWINSLKKIVDIKEDAIPFTTIPLTPEHYASYVLEIKSGMVRELGIKIGDTVKFIYIPY